MALLLLAASCGTPAPAEIILTVTNIPDGTVSVNLNSAPYDACFALPKRYAPAVAAAGVHFQRRCFLGEPTYTLDAWTYDAGCCIRNTAEVMFAGETDPSARDIGGNVSVTIPLAPSATVDCRPSLACGPQ